MLLICYANIGDDYQTYLAAKLQSENFKIQPPFGYQQIGHDQSYHWLNILLRQTALVSLD